MAQIERSAAGLQMIIPGCERRTMPKSSSSANWFGQGLLGYTFIPVVKCYRSEPHVFREGLARIDGNRRRPA